MNMFKRKALRVIADFLSNEEVGDIKEMFNKIDTDNDSIVSVEELKIGLQKFGSQLAAADVQLLIEAASHFLACLMVIYVFCLMRTKRKRRIRIKVERQPWSQG